MALTDVGATPVVHTTNTGDTNGGFGYGGGLWLAFLLLEQSRAVAATSEQSVLLNQSIANATALTNKYVADANVSILQGLAGVSGQICNSSRETDNLVVAQAASLNNTINCGNKELLLATLQGDAALQSSICALGANTQMGFKDTQLQIALGNKDIQLQQAKDTCAIIGTVHSDGERTRALITENRIEALEDEIASLRAAASETAIKNDILSIRNTQNNIVAILGTLAGNITQGGGQTPAPALAKAAMAA